MTPRPIQLAAALLPALAATGFAQLHSPQVTLHRKPKPVDYSWLLTYAQPAPNGNQNGLVNDPRFPTLLQQQFTALQSFWGSGGPVASAALDFFHGPPGHVLLESNRYLAANGCAQHFCNDRGLLFADLGTPDPLFVFAATDWISENRTTADADAAYTLWVFPNRALDPAHLPPALVRTISRWSAQPLADSATRENITRVFLVDPDNTPHALAPATIGAHTTLPAETGPDTTPDTKVPS